MNKLYIAVKNSPGCFQMLAYHESMDSFEKFIDEHSKDVGHLMQAVELEFDGDKLISARQVDRNA